MIFPCKTLQQTAFNLYFLAGMGGGGGGMNFMK